MLILEHLLDAEKCNKLNQQILQRYENISKANPSASLGDGLVSESFSAYALPETEELLLSLTETVSKITNKNLYPTYSYSRVYLPGAIMRPHTDRDACEISMSLCVGGDPWPIWFKLQQNTPVTIHPGNAVLYQGTTTVHWREEYTGTGCTQIFLHWVDADGPYSSWIYDRRPNIGAGENEKTYWGKS